MTYCKKCKQVIKNDNDKVNCAGQCNSVFHKSKDCCGISNSAIKYVDNYANVKYCCDACVDLQQPLNQPLNLHDDSLQLLDNQSTILNNLSKEVKSLQQTIIDKDSAPDHRDELKSVSQAVNRFTVKLNQLESDLRHRVEEQLNVAIDKINTKLSVIDKIAEFNNRMDDVLLKLELLDRPYEQNTLNFEMVFAELSSKIDILLNKSNADSSSPASEPVNYNNINVLTDKASKNIDKILNTPASVPTTSGWRFINERSKKVWKAEWKNNAKKGSDKYSNKNIEIRKNNNNKSKNRNKQNKSLPKNPQKNPVDIADFDKIISEFSQPQNFTNLPQNKPQYLQKINFKSGGIINPYRRPDETFTQFTDHIDSTPNAPIPPAVATSSNLPISFIDPIKPPVVKLTEQLGGTESRYVLARFRDRTIYERTRQFLAYFHDQPADRCLRNMTKMNLIMFLKSEGLPTEYNELKNLYFKYNIEYGNLTANDVIIDLNALRKHMTTERTNFLQMSKENYKRFYYPSASKVF